MRFVKKVFEYAVLRVVPSVERQEFINVGVLLYSRHHRYFGIKTHIDTSKLKALDPAIDLEIVERYIQAYHDIVYPQNVRADLDTNQGILALEPHERFRWLTANRSSMIQCSSIHSGLTIDAASELDILFGKLIL